MLIAVWTACNLEPHCTLQGVLSVLNFIFQDCDFPGHRDDFYPGQTLWGPLHCLDEAEWINCSKELKVQRAKANKIVKVVVEEVKTDSVGVHWQCRAYSKDGSGAEKEQPRFLVHGEDLKRCV